MKIETSVATSSGRPRCERPPWPAYSPSEFSRTITQSRSWGRHVAQRPVDAGQDARRAHIGVLVEALADREAQAPERDVVGHLGRADRAEIDGVEAVSCSTPSAGIMHAGPLVIVGAPVELA